MEEEKSKLQKLQIGLSKLKQENPLLYGVILLEIPSIICAFINWVHLSKQFSSTFSQDISSLNLPELSDKIEITSGDSWETIYMIVIGEKMIGLAPFIFVILNSLVILYLVIQHNHKDEDTK